MYITMPNILFFLSLIMPLIGESSEFNFSSQRPHLNYILLRWHLPEGTPSSKIFKLGTYEGLTLTGDRLAFVEGAWK